MSKPTADTKWSLTGTKTQPSSGQKDAGWTAGGFGFAQWMNWWMDAVDQWKVWLAAFELTAHAWTAAQDFSAAGIDGNLTLNTGNLSLTTGTIFADNNLTPHVLGLTQIDGTLDVISALTAHGTLGVTGAATFAALLTAAGVSSTAIAAGVPGVFGKGFTSGSAAGVTGNSGATTNTAAVAGVSLHDGVPGVRGQTHGSTGEAGVEGNAAANDGYGVSAIGKVTSPVRSSLRIGAQAADPTSPQLGDIYVNSGTKFLMVYNGTAWVKVSSQ